MGQTDYKVIFRDFSYSDKIWTLLRKWALFLITRRLSVTSGGTAGAGAEKRGTRKTDAKKQKNFYIFAPSFYKDCKERSNAVIYI